MESLLRVAAPPSFSHSPASYFTLMSSSHTLMPATILCIHWSLSNFSLFPSGMRSPWNQGHGSSHSLLHPQRPEQGQKQPSRQSCLLGVFNPANHWGGSGVPVRYRKTLESSWIAREGLWVLHVTQKVHIGPVGSFLFCELISRCWCVPWSRLRTLAARWSSERQQLKQADHTCTRSAALHLCSKLGSTNVDFSAALLLEVPI